MLQNCPFCPWVSLTMNFIDLLPINLHDNRGGDSNYVILISIDSLAVYYLENEELTLPNLGELIEKGVWAENSHRTFPSVIWVSRSIWKFTHQALTVWPRLRLFL